MNIPMVLYLILGIIGLLIALIALSISVAKNAFNRKVSLEVNELFKKSKQGTDIVTEEAIKGLPEPVQRYLRYTNNIGKKKIKTVRLKQKGFMRTKEGGNWLPFEAEEFFSTDPPAFIWNSTMRPLPFLQIKGRDKYVDGKGNMYIKLLPVTQIADATGPEMDQGAFLRYLNEMMWFPTAYLSKYIVWEAIDNNSAKATMSYKGVSVAAVVYFNEKGELINFVADRYMDVGGKFKLEKWSTPIKGYGELNGIRIPVKGEGVWNLDTGDFSYIALEVTNIEYID